MIVAASPASPVADPEPTLRTATAPAIADRVRAQLLGDYPPGALSWVDDLTWSGPVQVPVSQIDRTSGDTDWASAAGDKTKLAVFRRKIAGGFRKPVVLVRRPGIAKLFAVDGHTRILASLALGVPVMAWVGTAKTAHGSWERTHSRQLANHGPAVDLATTPGLTPRSGMISLDLPPGTIKPVPSGLTDHHVTVVYLGPDLDDDAFASACSRAKDAAASVPGPLAGTVSGVDSFPPSDGSKGKVSAFAPASIPGAKALRRKLEDLSASEHKTFVPHVALAYVGKGDPLPDPVPPTSVKFTHLSVHRGEDVKRFPFGSGSEHASDWPALDLSAQTAALEVTPAPAGKPGGPGLWRVKGMELPPYFQNIRNALIRDGHTPADAYQLTWGAIRRWAAGGGNVHPEVRAAAVRALADLKAKAAIAHAHANAGQRVIELVGPKGYVHGWHYVGPQAVGARVFHPQFGHGTVTGHDGSHATVRFDKGGVTSSFEARKDASGEAAKLAPRAEPAPVKSAVPEWQKAMDEQAAKMKAAGEANARGIGYRQALAHSGRVHFREATGLDLPHPADMKLTAGNGDYSQALGQLGAGKYAEGVASLDRAINAEQGTRNSDKAVARLTALRDKVAKATAKPKLTIPPLTKLRANPDGSITALDHTGTEYHIRLGDGRLTVSSAKGSLSETRTESLRNPTRTARALAGRISRGEAQEPAPGSDAGRELRDAERAVAQGKPLTQRQREILKRANDRLTAQASARYRATLGQSHANDGPAIDLAGVFTESLHPRAAGGKFGFKGGTPVAQARARHAPKTAPVPRPPMSPGQMSRAQQLRYQASQDRQLAHQIMIKVAALVRARDAAIAGIPAGKVTANVSAAKSAAAKKAAVARKAGTAKKTARKAAAGKPKQSKVARLNGQIRLLTGDARLLMKAADHLDAQAAGL